jgi:ORF6N domain
MSLGEEVNALKSQFAILKPAARGQHRKYLPWVFTEQGVAMLSSVLRSERAVQVNVAIMRTFVKLREILASHRNLARKVAEHDQQIAVNSGNACCASAGTASSKTWS